VTNYSTHKIFATLLTIEQANTFNAYVKKNSISKSHLLRQLLLDYLKINGEDVGQELPVKTATGIPNASEIKARASMSCDSNT
jgi:hypothetical protein